MNKKSIKMSSIICFIILSIVSSIAYADVVYPNDFKPTPSYLGIMIVSLAVIIIVGIIILLIIHKNNIKNNIEDNKESAKQQEEKKDV